MNYDKNFSKIQLNNYYYVFEKINSTSHKKPHTTSHIPHFEKPHTTPHPTIFPHLCGPHIYVVHHINVVPTCGEIPHHMWYCLSSSGHHTSGHRTSGHQNKILKIVRQNYNHELK